MVEGLAEAAAPVEMQQHSGRLILAVSVSLLVHFGIVFPELVLFVSSGAREGSAVSTPDPASQKLTVRLAGQTVGIERQLSELAARHADEMPSVPKNGQSGDVRDMTGAAESAQGASPLPDLPIGRQYYRSSELDEKPKPKTQVEPEFPMVVDPGVLGTVVARLFINDEGLVERVVVERSTPPGLFEESVQKAFTGAQYAPGKRKGRPVFSQIRIEIEFRSNPLK